MKKRRRPEWLKMIEDLWRRGKLPDEATLKVSIKHRWNCGRMKGKGCDCDPSVSYKRMA